MYLLIHFFVVCRNYFYNVFTFHYVSINSIADIDLEARTMLFTFHYVSINSRWNSVLLWMFFHLHSTMYLLIQLSSISSQRFSLQFTFHYVSINSSLLCSFTLSATKFTFHYVSINSNSAGATVTVSTAFTFHYVSINSRTPFLYGLPLLSYLHSTMYLLILPPSYSYLCVYHNLHSTMYLLIQKAGFIWWTHKFIYIPLCIY